MQGYRLGWTPSETWAATLCELELAIAVRIDDAEAAARASRPLSADEIAASWDRAGGADA